jgi:hypothetical protein
MLHWINWIVLLSLMMMMMIMIIRTPVWPLGLWAPCSDL